VVQPPIYEAAGRVMAGDAVRHAAVLESLMRSFIFFCGKRRLKQEI
jgi:hypothetical protein